MKFTPPKAAAYWSGALPFAEGGPFDFVGDPRDIILPERQAKPFQIGLKPSHDEGRRRAETGSGGASEWVQSLKGSGFPSL